MTRTERGSDFRHIRLTLTSLREATKPERAHLLARVKENAKGGSECDAFILRYYQHEERVVEGRARDLYNLCNPFGGGELMRGDSERAKGE